MALWFSVEVVGPIQISKLKIMQNRIFTALH